MTWPDGIALAVGLAALTLLTHHQHRSTTSQQHTSRTEHRNGPHHRPHPQGQRRQGSHGKTGRRENRLQEDSDRHEDR